MWKSKGLPINRISLSSFRRPSRLARAFADAAGELVAHVFARLRGERFEASDDLGIFSGDVARLADVVVQIVQLVRHGQRLVFAGDAVLAGRLAFHRARSVWEEKFAVAAAHVLELVDVVVKKVGVVRILRARIAGKKRPDVEAVDLVLGQFRARE